ncbi:hypothetical protein [Haloplanus sp. C73]|uniref:hypothetical protein n=1 Tax=Haloplanus sp. C73 TaxID=3421641 RepID=UPI003EB85811
MTSELRSRLGVLAGLAVLGVVLAVVGTALGLPSSLVTGAPAAQFVVSDERVTLSNSSDDVVLVDNMSNVREIQVETTGRGQFHVRTREEPPITAAERERALEIARTNDTVRQYLDSAEYTAAVEPVRIYNVSSDKLYTDTVHLNESGINRKDTDRPVTTYNVTLVPDESNETRGRVTAVHREPKSPDHRAVVQIRRPAAPDHRELTYTIDVDLRNGTITDITDWEALQQDSSVRTVSADTNVSTHTVGADS